MPESSHLLAIDQGTTGSRAFLFDHAGGVVSSAYREIRQHYPKPGWVEHDPIELWRSTLQVVHQVLAESRISRWALAAIGITNQRETAVLWNRKTGRPIGRAIVWQDRRTAAICRRLKRHEPLVSKITGLVLDPYFSGTKLTWAFEKHPSLKTLARKGELAFGTVDSWLLWNLTGGKVHATDATNASRTLLMDLHRFAWSKPMLKLLEIPESILPEVHPSSHRYGRTASSLGILPPGVPIAGIAGDQQAALFGQGCVRPGETKNTYGTGCFLMTFTGKRWVPSRSGLLTTAACDEKGQPAYALEGSVFIAGAAVQWLRDGLKIIRTASETETLARSVKDTGGVYFVPAFVGLGAPYWNPNARGLITGLTRGSTRAHIARAALEAIAHQSDEVISAMARDTRLRLKQLKVDGGATRNDFLMQFQADLSGIPVERPAFVESTVLGAAQLAGLGSGFWAAQDLKRMRRVEKVFRPRWGAKDRREAREHWQEAVRRAQ